MKLPSKIVVRDFWAVSQLFEGYGGYVYEVINPYSNCVYEIFAFIGDKFPTGKDDFEVCWDLNDGIYWLKNYGKNIPEWKRWINIKTPF